MYEAWLMVAVPPLPAVGHLGFLMKIVSLFSFVLLSAATLPAEAYDLPEHTVSAFNLSACPKGWVQYAPAAGAFVVGVGDSFQLGRGGVVPTNVAVADAGNNSAPKASKVADSSFVKGIRIEDRYGKREARKGDHSGGSGNCHCRLGPDRVTTAPALSANRCRPVRRPDARRCRTTCAGPYHHGHPPEWPIQAG